MTDVSQQGHLEQLENGQDEPTRPKTVRAVHNAMAVLRLLCEASRPLGITEIAQQVGLSKPAVHALLATLREERLVTQDRDTARYAPGWELAVLAQSMSAGNALLSRARQELATLADAIGEAVLLAAPEENDVVVLDARMGRNPVQLIVRSGSRVPLHATAVGKVALAWPSPAALDDREAWALERYTDRTITDLDDLRSDLERGRARGYMRAEEEHQDGISSIAVPVLAPGVGVVAIFTAAFPTRTLTTDREQFIAEAMRAAAQRCLDEFA